ncbi:hypothetical protein LAZ67_13003117 [Cordylochernes scorpioides]|uniref:GIY-YIG domain-containing protein n=1 Tax=Cordylochernes scorpioides TaxID=51811 RepID=A0ABY6L7K5_9ARAC|nr:hypothetical protein LAZ67_13003117 [Cordylochernes scorpioides]
MNIDRSFIFRCEKNELQNGVRKRTRSPVVAPWKLKRYGLARTSRGCRSSSDCPEDMCCDAAYFPKCKRPPIPGDLCNIKEQNGKCKCPFPSSCQRLGWFGFYRCAFDASFNTTTQTTTASINTTTPATTASINTTSTSTTESINTTTPATTASINTTTTATTASINTTTTATTASINTTTPATTESINTTTPATTASINTTTPATTESINTTTPASTASINTTTPATTASINATTPATTTNPITPATTTRVTNTTLTTTTTTTAIATITITATSKTNSNITTPMKTITTKPTTPAKTTLTNTTSPGITTTTTTASTTTTNITPETTTIITTSSTSSISNTLTTTTTTSNNTTPATTRTTNIIFPVKTSTTKTIYPGISSSTTTTITKSTTTTTIITPMTIQLPTSFNKYHICCIPVRPEESLDSIHTKLNSLFPDIQFTVEKENNCSLAFLDIMITKQNCRYSTTVYYKPSFHPSYIHYSSYCPLSHKINTIKTLSKRIFTHCSTSEFKQTETQNVINHLMNLGYPRNFILRHFHNPQQQLNNRLASSHTLPITLKNKYGIRTYYTNTPKLETIVRNPITRNSFPITLPYLTNSVYSLKCSDCNSLYIGETGRRIKDRIDEHHRNIRNSEPRSLIVQHIRQTGHSFNTSHPQAYYSGIKSKYKRLVVEAVQAVVVEAEWKAWECPHTKKRRDTAVVGKFHEQIGVELRARWRFKEILLFYMVDEVVLAATNKGSRRR